MRFTTYVSFLLSSVLVAIASTTNVTPNFSPFDSQDFCSQIITPTCNTTFSYIDELNAQIRPHISKLVTSPYFRYFKLDFDKQCKFWNAQHFCATRNCAVEILPTDKYNWTQVDGISPLDLGEIQRPELQDDDAVGTCEDLDYCHIDEGHNCVYVDLVENPERFTGYGGNQSLDVWKAIYSENCFPNTNPMSMTDSDSQPEQCVEKNLFYRLISGLHASIAVHLSNEYLCPEHQEDSHGEQIFEPNLKIFMERVGSYNDRLSNIYFNYALVSQAIVKLSEIFQGGLADQILCGGSSEAPMLHSNDELDYKETFSSILPHLASNDLFNTDKLFDPKVVSPELKNEFRQRFKNVSAIMDCVGCDRCRMWGKVQTIGYGTALKILFESDEHKPIKFRRIELVGLFNTFDRLTKSVEAINNFKKMYMDHLEDVRLGKAQLGAYAKGNPNQKGFSFPFMAHPQPKPSSGVKHSISSQAAIVDNKAANKTKKRIIKSVSNHTRTFGEEFMKAFDEVMEAAYFVVNSYKQFLPSIWRYSIIKLNNWWDSFIGRGPTKYYEQPLAEDVVEDAAAAEAAYKKLFVN
jgi:ERO1-like protein beta